MASFGYRACTTRISACDGGKGVVAPCTRALTARNARVQGELREWCMAEGVGLEPSRVARSRPVGRLAPQGALPPDCSRGRDLVDAGKRGARCPRLRGEYLPTPLPLWVRVPKMALVWWRFRETRVMAEGGGLEPTKGLPPAGFRDRSLSQFGAPLLPPDYRRDCLKVGGQAGGETLPRSR